MVAVPSYYDSIGLLAICDAIDVVDGIPFYPKVATPETPSNDVSVSVNQEKKPAPPRILHPLLTHIPVSGVLGPFDSLPYEEQQRVAINQLVNTGQLPPQLPPHTIGGLRPKNPVLHNLNSNGTKPVNHNNVSSSPGSPGFGKKHSIGGASIHEPSIHSRKGSNASIPPQPSTPSVPQAKFSEQDLLQLQKRQQLIQQLQQLQQQQKLLLQQQQQQPNSEALQKVTLQRQLQLQQLQRLHEQQRLQQQLLLRQQQQQQQQKLGQPPLNTPHQELLNSPNKQQEQAPTLKLNLSLRPQNEMRKPDELAGSISPATHTAASLSPLPSDGDQRSGNSPFSYTDPHKAVPSGDIPEIYGDAHVGGTPSQGLLESPETSGMSFNTSVANGNDLPDLSDLIPGSIPAPTSHDGVSSGDLSMSSGNYSGVNSPMTNETDLHGFRVEVCHICGRDFKGRKASTHKQQHIKRLHPEDYMPKRGGKKGRLE